MPKLVDLPEPGAFSPHEVRLIEATYAAIARQGVQQLSLRAIAREIDVSPGLLVYHFSSHENLLLATMQWAFDQAVQRIRDHVEEIEDPLDLLSALLDAMFNGAESNREHIMIYMDFMQFGIRNPDLGETMKLWRKYMSAVFASVVRVGAEAGEFQVENVDAAARHARAIVEGHCLQWIQEDDWKKMHKVLRRECETYLLAFLRGRHAERVN
ncbi:MULTISPECIES: TetR/AcrR family transcriptional regulator [unclassified Streptomyces]|uniref:TetR/AcrR family transcriptional regulator n=1 Tax=unclassified Streptomyces TaxID=2593676 RepID=UPI0036EAEFE0